MCSMGTVHAIKGSLSAKVTYRGSHLPGATIDANDYLLKTLKIEIAFSKLPAALTKFCMAANRSLVCVVVAVAATFGFGPLFLPTVDFLAPPRMAW